MADDIIVVADGIEVIETLVSPETEVTVVAEGIPGPGGATGPTGATGAQGPQGEQGAPGYVCNPQVIDTASGPVTVCVP